MDFENKDHYQILGISRSATKEQVREAYLEIARIYHPDSNYYSDLVDTGTNNEEQHIFKIVTAAYNVLNDDRKRAEYTATLPPDDEFGGMTEEQSAKMFSEAKNWHRSRVEDEESKRSAKYRERKNTVSMKRPRADSMTMSAFGREAMIREQVAKENQEKMRRRFVILAMFIIGVAIGTVLLVVTR